MNKKIYRLFKHSVLLSILVFSFESKALESSNSTGSAHTNDLTLSLGNLCEYIGKVQTDEKGSTNVCSFLPSLSSSLDYYMTPNWALSPQIGATLPKSGRDQNITRMTMIALMNLKYKTDYAHLIFGTGFFFTRVSGNGGEEVLNNGNSTESFPLPRDAVWSRNFIVNLGASADFNQSWSSELYTYIFNIEDSKERAFSAGVNLTYHFGEVL